MGNFIAEICLVNKVDSACNERLWNDLRSSVND